jgi:hypothetical protein
MDYTKTAGSPAREVDNVDRDNVDFTRWCIRGSNILKEPKFAEHCIGNAV